ncbi:hypothetical protein [Streptomyces sp. NBC_01255]|nr:hypothetical protein [Streptomyces sp. NBC_01255]
MVATVIAVIGILRGAVVAGLIQRRTVRTTRDAERFVTLAARLFD